MMKDRPDDTSKEGMSQGAALIGVEGTPEVLATELRLIEKMLVAVTGGKKPQDNQLYWFMCRGGEDDFFHREIFERENTSLVAAVALFGDMLARLGLNDSPLFQNEAMREDFRQRLMDFTHYIDRELVGVERTIEGSEMCSNFSPFWKENLKTAAYYAFFIHYGARRKAEKDAQGRSQDYVYHVIRAAIENLIHKGRFFCEKTVIAAMWHDVLEDWHEGFAGLLFSKVDCDPADMDEQKTWRTAPGELLRKNHRKGFEKHFSHACDSLDAVSGLHVAKDDPRHSVAFNSSQVGIEDLVRIVTKSTKNKKRQLVEMMEKILAKKGMHRFSAVRAMIMKTADKLDNVRTFMGKILATEYNQEQVENKFRRVSEDTIYFFIAFAVANKMWNILDWLYDYLKFANPGEREKRIALRLQRGVHKDQTEETSEEMSLKDQFRSEFLDMLRQQMGDGALNEGEQYILQFRPVGFRYEDEGDAVRMAETGSYERAMQNYIVFRCVENNPELFFGAVEVFKKMFPKPLKGKWFERREFESILGRRFCENRMGVPPNEHSYSDKYGVGAWSVFASAGDLSGRILGSYNRAFFYKDREAEACRDRVLEMLAEVEPQVRVLATSYGVLDFCINKGGPEVLVESIRERLARVAVKFEPLKPRRSEYGSWADKLEPVIDDLAMLMFALRERKVNVVVEGIECVQYIPRFKPSEEIQERMQRRAGVPGLWRLSPAKQEESYDQWAELVFCAPWALGRPVSHVLRDQPSKDGSEPSLVYNIDLRDSFRPRLFDEQTRFLPALLEQLREDLMSDHVAVQGRVLTPSEVAVAKRGYARAKRKVNKKRGRDRRGTGNE